MTPPSLSVVIPAFNESAKIASSLAQIERYLVPRGISWEIVVVDDGSTDRTAEKAREYRSASSCREQIRLLENGVNRGKGFSVRRGFLESRGDIVLFSDCDLSAPIEECEKLIAPIRGGRSDATFGSRAMAASEIRVHQPAYRELGGKCFNLFVRVIAGLPFSDTQCGFKAFRREPFVAVFERQTIERFGFDVEILYLARKRGLRLTEIPVAWEHSPDTRVSYGRDSIDMFLDLWRIRRNDWRGRYN